MKTIVLLLLLSYTVSIPDVALTEAHEEKSAFLIERDLTGQTRAKAAETIMMDDDLAKRDLKTINKTKKVSALTTDFQARDLKKDASKEVAHIKVSYRRDLKKVAKAAALTKELQERELRWAQRDLISRELA